MASTGYDFELENAVGYRFSPTDEELVNHYLRQKMLGVDHEVGEVPELNVCELEPWDLAANIRNSENNSDNPKWYFFSPRIYRYSKNKKANRRTKLGYWKATGRDRKVKSERINEEIGIKKTLVYHQGRVPNGVKTNWVIHEYTATLNLPNQGKEFVLCKLKKNPGDVPNVEDESSPVLDFEQDQSITESNDVPAIGEGNFSPQAVAEHTSDVEEVRNGMLCGDIFHPKT
ncbi:hypothetical protein K2173_004923 [Erythroxylum novogranatense]|uniref:NAC domain-containing protein n=1 Tax=Erythroxylum novogranatense TaxID=1862640 RepID=A0AAV8UD57_9ROSI|nr:hypothetical protein K2173_004923 [Erythroxylum novogranatense]